MPLPTGQQLPGPNPDPGRPPPGGLRTLSRQGDARRSGRGRGDDLQGRPRHPARGDPLPAQTGTRKWLERPLEPVGNDLWRGSFEPAQLGRWQFAIEAWVDRYATLLDELDRKLAAGQADLTSEQAEAEALFGPGEYDDWRAAAPALGAKDRHGKVASTPLEADVERERARFGAWYELFPRSWGGFKGVQKVLPQLAELGFDVIYLPPIHPIGTTNRKGRNNALIAEPGDPGSPWAIGGSRRRA